MELGQQVLPDEGWGGRRVGDRAVELGQQVLPGGGGGCTRGAGERAVELEQQVSLGREGHNRYYRAGVGVHEGGRRAGGGARTAGITGQGGAQQVLPGEGAGDRAVEVGQQVPLGVGRRNNRAQRWD